MRVLRCRHAWVDDRMQEDVDIAVDEDGRITRVGAPDPTSSAAVTELPGVVLPGFANAHSHAFHRALRGRTHAGGGTFWTWRQRMYEVAAVLDPDLYYELARAVYGEMVLAGVTSVGEFHYVHHAPDGSPYEDPNAMGEALRHAARDAGLRLTLLDTCYLSGGLSADGYLPLDPGQRRFGDVDANRWAERVARMADDDSTRVGAAIHSVRAVPYQQIPLVVAAAQGRPLHAHVSEQPAENDACTQAFGMTPTRLLGDGGFLGGNSTVVHATHLTPDDIRLLGDTATSSCFCPTTERDLADGIGPAMQLRLAGSPLCLGSDQHAVVDMLEEARALEMHERLQHLERGRLQMPDLMASLTENGHRCLGWPDAGRIAAGHRADLVAVATDTVRTAGSDPAQILFAAFAGDIDTVVVDGRVVVAGGRHRSIDVASELGSSIDRVWRRVAESRP